LLFLYYDGPGVSEDYECEAQLHKKAADQGISEAQFALALFYESGKGIEQDASRALELLQLAANQGNMKAWAHVIPSRESENMFCCIH